MPATSIRKCPRCSEMRDMWHSSQVCAHCRYEEGRNIGKTQKGKAWAAVTRAIRSGAIARKPCEVCGHVTSQAHHDDYARALTIRWLCRSCHRNHHVKHGPGKNAYATT